MPDLRERINALSWQSRSTLSRAPKEMAALPQAGENIESLIRFSGADIVTGPGTSPLRDPAVRLNWGESFDTVWDNFAALSKALGADDPTPDFKGRLEKLQKPSASPRALYLDRAGGTAGPGTFVHAVFEAAGVDNVVSTPGWHSPETETLLRYDPDLIITSFMDSDYAGVTDTTLRHAALSKRISDFPHVEIPGSFWPCAGPGLVEAAEHLSAALTKS